MGLCVIDAPAFRVENGRLDGAKLPSRLGYVVPDWTGTPCCGDFNSLHLPWRDADCIRYLGAKNCCGVPLGKTRCAHDVDMGRSWVDLSAGTSLGVAASAEWLHICKAPINKGGLKPALVR